MSYRKILVPFSGSDRNAGMLLGVLSFAKAHKAHCEVLFVLPEPYQALPYLGEAAPGIVVSDIVDAANKAADIATNRLKRAIDAAAKESGLVLLGADEQPAPGVASVKYVEMSGDAPGVILSRSRLSDLVVFVGGQAESQIGMPTGLSSVLMNGTRPVLVLPSMDYTGGAIGTVAIAWDGSAESANAVRAAMPILRQAKTIKILNIQHNLLEGGVKTDISDALGVYLDLHGVTSHAEVFVDPHDKSVAEVILDQIGLASCDFLVMGGYGHSRVRELLLGGVTQHILEHATVPTLLAH